MKLIAPDIPVRWRKAVGLHSPIHRKAMKDEGIVMNPELGSPGLSNPTNNAPLFVNRS